MYGARYWFDSGMNYEERSFGKNLLHSDTLKKKFLITGYRTFQRTPLT